MYETGTVDDLHQVLAQLDPRVSHLVSDGGDGALHWLVNGMRSRVADPDDWPTYVPTNSGAIDFVARKASVRGSADGIVRALAAAAAADRPPPEIWLDTLQLNGETEEGDAFDRVGFALAAGGVGNRFFDEYYRDPDPGRSTIARVIARAIADYAAAGLVPGRRGRRSVAARLFTPTAARVVIDGAELATRTHSALHAGAFEVNLGGVLRVFPRAREPGVLHFRLASCRPRRSLRNCPR